MGAGWWAWKCRVKQLPTAVSSVVFLLVVVVVVMTVLCHQDLTFCSALNTEGLALLKFREKVERDPFGVLSSWGEKDGDVDPCSWFGLGCSGDGKVVVLDLKDLCLEGTLAPEIGMLAYLKSIVLRNNSFSGNIPKEIGELKELEVLDLGFNNFSGPFPLEFVNNLSLTTLLLDNNKFLGSISPELHELKVVSEVQVHNDPLRACTNRDMTWKTAQPRGIAHRMLLQAVNTPSLIPPSFSPSSPSPSTSESPLLSPSSSFSLSPSPSESPSISPAESPSILPLPPIFPVEAPTPASSPPANPPIAGFAPRYHNEVPMHPSSIPSQKMKSSSPSKHHIFVIAGIVAGCLFALIAAIGVILTRSSKVVTVRPWATGLSGQLQKAFVTGVPKLRRSELEAACEDFSNIIGSFPDGTVYKGTLSSGVEIAVTSIAVNSREDWSKNSEAQFRKKIDLLSKVNHKNFVNLIGYCEEDVPFTRMMVFEYAPNGTLFEHLHIKEAEHLDWGMRLRIAMGMAYCLEYMHQLTPPIAHKNLQSSSVYLTEDYAAKISDFNFWTDLAAAKIESASIQLLEFPPAEPEGNVYSFGLILLEMITGRIPSAEDKTSLAACASDYLRRGLPLREVVDPTLKSFHEVELEKLFEVIKDCMNTDTRQRPTMREVAARLKEITAMGPDGATPKLSPLWWAELEILSNEGS